MKGINTPKPTSTPTAPDTRELSVGCHTRRAEAIAEARARNFKRAFPKEEQRLAYVAGRVDLIRAQGDSR